MVTDDILSLRHCLCDDTESNNWEEIAFCIVRDLPLCREANQILMQSLDCFVEAYLNFINIHIIIVYIIILFVN
jgi:hypothetical protein